MSNSDSKLQVVPAVTFLDSFAKLPHKIQTKANSTVAAMMRSSTLKGLNYEALAGKNGYYSVRVDLDYRIIALVKGACCLALWVAKHDDAYDWAQRHKVVFDPAGNRVCVVAVMPETIPAQTPAPAEVPKECKKTPKVFPPIFAPLGKEKLAALGVPDEFMKAVLGVQDAGRLRELKDVLTIPTYEALDFLLQNEKYEDVLEFYLAAVDGSSKSSSGSSDPDSWDAASFVEALKSAYSRAQFLVPENENELRDALFAPLEQWRFFLHPTQTKYAKKNYRGPVRVLGSAGTGKTVVAIHRAKYLAEHVFTEPEDRVLVTTFTRNLASDVRAQLEKICSRETMARVDVVNISSWAASFIKKQKYSYILDYDGTKRERLWDQAFEARSDAVAFSKQFYKDEYALVVQPQNIDSLAGYKRASRVGRGKPLGRKEKEAAWQVFAEFQALVAETKIKDYDDLYADVAAMLENEKNKPAPYRAAVVDEAQDFSLNAFKMLRKMVPEGDNDLFLVGDARQRIYGYKSSLSAAGVNIRGRGQKLRVNYRTTSETYRFASAIMSGSSYDDLDGGEDPQNACVSLRSGMAPFVRVFEDAAAEKQAVEEILNQIVADSSVDVKSSALNSVCLVARTKAILDEFVDYLNERNFSTVKLDSDGSLDGKDGLRAATVHRVKGLEFDDVILVGANEGVLPLKSAVDACDKDDPVALELAEKKERSLLYVALTRARRTAYITANGELSAFVKHAMASAETDASN